MPAFLNNAARFFLSLAPVADTQAYCAREVSREKTKVQGQLRAEYTEIFKSDLCQLRAAH